uniref:protein-disulfide reductase n=1 Tax=Panagrellus redivivus TaxID=6233 RepID=A0A7E4W513_PANRE
MASLFTDIPLKRNGGGAATAEDLKGKMVALYFSAHWCPPCREFTPKLKKFYEEAVNAGLEIVFISWDNTAKDQEAYLNKAHGNWLYIPHGDAGIEKLNKKYNMRGVPWLVLLNNDGSKAINDVVDDVEDLTVKDALKKWADKVV